MNPYVALAEKAVNHYIKEAKIIEVPQELPEEFYSQRAGVFVTIHKGTELRGCIGTYLPTKQNIAQEIIINAIEACSNDYRFEPIRQEELEDLHIQVSILSAPIKIKSREELDVKKYGVIVSTKDGRKGLLLPDLEGVDTVSKQLEIASMKGDIDLDKEEADIYKFEVIKYQ
ncbi:MAG: AmmeMemoRadiSam system protein A [Candidatus Moranbacteria bacterium]|nr:AmmeMemoRadiSam system protein A [Candidatus Moranbacteria bacterium]